MKHVPVELSAAQVRALKKGGAIIMKPSMLVEGGKHTLALSEPTIKKLMSAMKKGKGMRVMLDEKMGEGYHVASGQKKGEKHDETMGEGYHVPSGQKKGEKHGGKHVGLAVKSMVGDGHQGEKDREDEKLAMEVHDLKHGGSNPFTKAAKSVSKGAKKATKSVSKGAKKATKSVSKAAKSAGKSAGKAAKKGAKAVGKTAKDISKSPEFQALAKAALEEGGKMAGTAAGAYLGGTEGAAMGADLGSTLGRVGADQIGTKSSDRASQLARSSLREGSRMLDRSGVATSHPLTTALAKQALERKIGEGMRSYSARMILPSSDEMTLSPFARVNSAQMSPYIHSSPQLARRIVRGNGMRGMGMHGMGIHAAGQFGGNIFPPGQHGGNIFPPGQHGGSIYPSGSSVHTIGQGHRGLMHGGLIYNPDNDPMLERQNRRIRATMNRMRGQGINPAGV
jgi:hypothetical protein